MNILSAEKIELLRKTYITTRMPIADITYQLGISESSGYNYIKDLRKFSKRKSKNQKGSKNMAAKLNEQQAIEILIKYFTGGISLRDLAKQYNVSHATIGFICRRKTWKHLFQDDPYRKEYIQKCNAL